MKPRIDQLCDEFQKFQLRMVGLRPLISRRPQEWKAERDEALRELRMRLEDLGLHNIDWTIED